MNNLSVKNSLWKKGNNEDKMISKVMEIHICEHCRKLYQRKHACIKHEIHCKQNPNNKHACFEFCNHLERLKIKDTYFDHNGCDMGDYISHIEFNCKKTDTELFSYIAERKGLKVIKHATRMPIKCNDFQIGSPESY